MVTRTYTITEKDIPAFHDHTMEMLSHDQRLEQGVFFDIETTGFSPATCGIYLIGCCRRQENAWQLIQWMAQDESPEEQRAILEQFFQSIQDAAGIISYNGATFDLPFIEKKAKFLGLTQDFSRWDHLDLYKTIRPFGAFLGLNSLKLKSVEQFLSIHREDTYSGGALIPIYKAYAKSHSASMEELLLLHNCEDIKDMLFILPVLAYPYVLAEGAFSINHVKKFFPIAGEEAGPVLPKNAAPMENTVPMDGATFPKNAASPENFSAWGINISLKPQLALPLPLDKKTLTLPGTDLKLGLKIWPDQICLFLPMIRGEMKFFYDNYKDYYYLPQEDYAIHKSVAAYVDKDCRKKATAKTCYTKKAGEFLPQPEKLFTPAFKNHYEDKISWFEYNPGLFSAPEFSACIQRFLRLFILGSF